MSPFAFLFPIAKFGRFYHVFIFGMQRFYIVPAIEQLVFPFAIGLPDQPTITALISLSRFLQNLKEKYP